MSRSLSPCGSKTETVEKGHRTKTWVGLSREQKRMARVSARFGFTSKQTAPRKQNSDTTHGPDFRTPSPAVKPNPNSGADHEVVLRHDILATKHPPDPHATRRFQRFPFSLALLEASPTTCPNGYQKLHGHSQIVIKTNPETGICLTTAPNTLARPHEGSRESENATFLASVWLAASLGSWCWTYLAWPFAAGE